MTITTQHLNLIPRHISLILSSEQDGGIAPIIPEWESGLAPFGDASAGVGVEQDSPCVAVFEGVPDHGGLDFGAPAWIYGAFFCEEGEAHVLGDGRDVVVGGEYRMVFSDFDLAVFIFS